MTRIAPFAVFAACVFTALWALSPASETPQKLALRPLVVYAAQPSKLIEHDIEWKAATDSARRETMLTGPRLYATELAIKQGASEAIMFGWYELTPAEPSATATTKRVGVSTDEGTSVATLSLGESAFFLSHMQQLSEGTPPEVPDGLSQFVAYRITEGSGLQPEAKLTTSAGETAFEFKRPVFLCLPVEEWHHDEHFIVKDASACWIVYEISPVENSSSVSTLDQFGLNKLELGSAKWICLPARVISDGDTN